MPPRPRVPAYERIAADLRERIARGEFSHDVALPSADALAADYSVSRRTAHRAVRVLVDEACLSCVRTTAHSWRDIRLRESCIAAAIIEIVNAAREAV